MKGARFGAALLAAAVFVALAAHGSAGAQTRPAPPPSIRPTARSSDQGRQVLERSRLLMGTMCTVHVEAFDTTSAAAAVERTFADIARLDSLLSPWRAESDLSRLNGLPGQNRRPVLPELYDLLELSLGLAEETDGAFDPSLDPLIRAWDLRGGGRVPDRAVLSTARERSGWRKVQLDRTLTAVRFQSDSMGVDLDGITRGWALDRAARILRDAFVKRARVDLGGRVLVMSDGEPFGIEIADPADRLRPVVSLVARNTTISTASQSERGFEVAGRRYGHVLDPATGEPVPSTASCTVVTGLGARADALSIALLVMGREKAWRWLEGRQDLGVLWLEPAGGEVRAWRWDLPAAQALTGARLKWME
jgi:thiamine biosynthesis lipoprotein